MVVKGRDMDDRRAANTGFALHGWLGLGLIAVFWPLNWLLEGPRTHWGFFPLWLGFCLTVDALTLRRRGTSLLQRDPRCYVGLFVISAPAWWLFELFNARLGNWYYDGRELFSDLEYGVLATIAFSTVIPAVFGAAELMRSFPWVERFAHGPKVLPAPRTKMIFFLLGCGMLALMLAWPRYFFPFLWVSLYFLLEAANLHLGNRSLLDDLARGDWRPVFSLWGGVLLTAFFWEMWNYYSYPKWVYRVPFVDFWHIFEMPLLGYGGYLPFSLELFAMYHLIVGLLGEKDSTYLNLNVSAH